MKEEQIKDFTRRISQCNKGEMIVIIYDILFAYMEDAKESYAVHNYEGFKLALKKAEKAVDELIKALSFRYDIAKDLYSLYVFAKESMAKAVIKNRLKEVEDARRVLYQLYEAFVEAAKQDHSEPLMKNTQQVYAGMTYGKNNLTETFQELETSRGFFA
ncbi:MAG: flagellar protein FliS [Lachnospiraceae bacterium]|nr:flagellar protein FliS [Lachnospiraceae bacterium]